MLCHGVGFLFLPFSSDVVARYKDSQVPIAKTLKFVKNGQSKSTAEDAASTRNTEDATLQIGGLKMMQVLLTFAMNSGLNAVQKIE